MQSIEEILASRKTKLEEELKSADWWMKRRAEILAEISDIDSKVVEVADLREAKIVADSVTEIPTLEPIKDEPTLETPKEP